MLKLERRTTGHFVTLNEISVHLIRGVSGRILFCPTDSFKRKTKENKILM